MSSTPKMRKSVKKMQKRLSSYAAMAAAATATATNCEASIVVYDINVTSPEVSPGLFALDVDIDGGMAGLMLPGDVDVYLQSTVGFTAFANTPSDGGVAYGGLIGPKALQLSPSTDVGSPDLDFNSNALLSESAYTPSIPFNLGYWGVPDRGFLGVQFLIGGDTHFGWVDLSINGDWSLTVNRVAYNDVPGESVHVEGTAGGAVPEPASGMVWLTMLAAGATGVCAFRKRLADQQAA